MASKSMFEPAPTQSPDDFATGQPDKFVGVIDLVLSYPYVGKQSKDGRHYLYIGVHMEPEEDSGYEGFTEKYFAGYLNKGVPSKDNEWPAGGDDEFYVSLSKGEAELKESCLGTDGNVVANHPNVGRYIIGRPDKSRNWHQFLTALRDADEKGIIDWSLPGYDLARFHGLKCRFDRVPQEGATQAAGQKQQQSFPVLVPTKVFGYVEKSGKAKSAAASKSSSSKSAAASSDNGSGDLESRIVDGVLSALKEAGGKLKKGVLITKVSKGFDKSERGDVMAWIGENSNLVDIEGTEFDLDELTLELA